MTAIAYANYITGKRKALDQDVWAGRVHAAEANYLRERLDALASNATAAKNGVGIYWKRG
jgi:hypothetical protein